MRQIEVLNLEWSSFPSRDREAASLVCNYLRYMGLSVFEGCVFNGFRLIDKLKPRLLYINCINGASINLELMRYAKSRGIICVTGVAEGNFRESEIDEFVWGNNRDKKIIEDVLLLWSEFSKAMTLRRYPELENDIRVVGSPGFDKYKIIKQDDSWLDACVDKSKYRKVVGLGCWDFGLVYEDDYRFSSYYKSFLSSEEIEFFRNDRDKFNREMLELVASNSDSLFILKEHPANQLGHFASGIEGCDAYENVVILKNEISIAQCIALADVWLSYESTTAMEAWAMGVQTALLNPSGTDFSLRSDVYRGQPCFTSADELSAALDEFYENDEVPGFTELSSVREQIIRDVMQWDDGFNHARIGNIILDYLDGKLKPADRVFKRKVSQKLRLAQTILWSGSPFLRFFNQRFANFWEKRRSRWSDKELADFNEDLSRMQAEFYESQGMDSQSLHALEAL